MQCRLRPGGDLQDGRQQHCTSGIARAVGEDNPVSDSRYSRSQGEDKQGRFPLIGTSGIGAEAWEGDFEVLPLSSVFELQALVPHQKNHSPAEPRNEDVFFLLAPDSC